VSKANLSLLAKSSALLLSLGAALLAGNAGAAEEDAIAARLQGRGTVCVFGQECAVGMRVPGAPTGPKAPQDVYNTYCQACHTTGANNSPIFGNAEAWAPRIEKGLDALYTSAINGFNNGAMPPRGTCVDCTDDELKATVDHMVAAVQTSEEAAQ
jgi:cytochrome c5